MTSIDLHPEHWQEPTVVLRQVCVYRRRSCYKSSFNLSMKLELKHKSFERKQDSPVEKLLDSLSPLSLMILLQIRKLTKTALLPSYLFPLCILC